MYKKIFYKLFFQFNYKLRRLLRIKNKINPKENQSISLEYHYNIDQKKTNNTEKNKIIMAPHLRFSIDYKSIKITPFPI